MADGGAIDVDGTASLLPGLDLFIHLLLFSDDGSQCGGHSLELLLVCVMKVVHVLRKRLVYQMVAAGILGGCFMYHGDDFTQEGDFLIL